MSVISSAFTILFEFVFAIVFFVLFKVMVMIAVGFDCKSRGVKDKTLWMVLTFFFTIIAGIVYACRCNDLEKNVPKLCVNCNTTVAPNCISCPNCSNTVFVDYQINNKDKITKKRKTSLIIAVISIVISVVFYSAMVYSSVEMFGGWDAVKKGDLTEFYNKFDEFNDYSVPFESFEEQFDTNYDYYDEYDADDHFGYNVNGETVYYDKTGKAYTDDDDVLYYDSDGNSYEYDDDEYLLVDEKGKTYNLDIAYIDEKGNLYFDISGGLITIDEGSSFYYQDGEGNKYFNIFSVSWDKDGNMVDYKGELLLK